MTRQEFKDFICRRVEELQGCKTTELVFDKQVAEQQDLRGNWFDIPALINELVEEGKLLELDYILPDINWRIKSFVLPAGTKILKTSRL